MADVDKESTSLRNGNADSNGFENGWTYVLVMNEGQEPLVGYIWHSFLEPIP